MPTYIEQCDRPHHPDRTHVHATRDGYPDTVLYGTPGVTEAHGCPRLRTAWGDERLFSKSPPPAQPCAMRSHPDTPHTHTPDGLWGDPSTGPGLDREQRYDGSWVVYSKAASHSVTPRRQVHLCEDPTHGGGHAHQMFPLDRIHTHSTVGWGDPAVPELVRSPRVKDENGEDMLFSSDPLQVTVEFTEPAKPEHTVERCEYAHHPRERHVHTSPPNDGRFGGYWRIHGAPPLGGREDYLINRHSDGTERVFSRGDDDIGTGFTPSPSHALPTTEWEDGGPSE